MPLHTSPPSRSLPHAQKAKRRAPGWAAALLVVALGACGGGGDDPPAWTAVDASGVTAVQTTNLVSTLAGYAIADLTTGEAAGLVWMRQEEQLAHDVYAASAALQSLPIFANIAASETTHAAAVGVLLERYGLADPLSGMPQGQYPDATLQALHDQLVATSATGLIAALQVGVQIEELDIVDLQARLAQTDNADIQLVYENLMRGSRNHLRAFMSTLTQQGGSYAPQYLSQAAFDAIVNSAMETGR